MKISFGKDHRHMDEITTVFDRFLVVKLYNDHLSGFHRKLCHEADALGKKVFKGTRWSLLKNPENLDENGERINVSVNH